MVPLLLVVDDDIDDIELVQDALTQIPHAPDLKYFPDAEGIITFFKEKEISLMPPLAIALDINLPGINGIDLLVLLKSDTRLNHIPISMVTTSSSVDQKVLCIEKGANHFFTKPVRISDWVKIIQSIVHDLHPRV